jgi:ribosomal protein L11 methyltransferase
LYFSVTIHLDEAAAGFAEALLQDAGCLGWEVREHGLLRAPGLDTVAEGQVVLVAYFEGAAAMSGALRHLTAELPDVEIRAEPVKAEDWSETWKQHVHPVRAGRVWVGPAWLRNQAGDAPVAITIDPGMAFGTGDHPTTELCLHAVDDFVARRPGTRVLDVGTGSGVLAIAAKLLGAAEAVGIDNDPVAVDVARANAELNHAAIDVSDQPLAAVPGRFDCIVANILPEPLIDLARDVVNHVAPDGEIFLSGIPSSQDESVIAVYEGLGWDLATRKVLGEWVLLALRASTPPGQ